MAVTLKGGVTWSSFDKHTFVNQLMAMGCVLNVTPLHSIIGTPNGKSVVMSVKSNILSEYTKGKLPEDKMRAMDHMLTVWFKKAVEQAANIPIEAAGLGDPQKTPASVAASNGFPVMDNPMSEPAVPLLQATRLYQRVKGSSPESVYFFIAQGEGLKIAARGKNTALSVRAEWDKSAQATILNSLEASEFTLKGNYASIHLNAPSPQMMARALGSLLYSLSITWESPQPNFDRLMQLCEQGAV